MGIYNCAETLPEALDSLLNQTYQDFKVIMCDDGSTDNTYEVAKTYSDNYENFILIKNDKNLKLAATLNRCLEYADTEYIARMDGDDISLPTRFEKEIEFLDNNPEFALVSCPMIHFDELGNWGFGNSIQEPTREDFKKGTPFCHAPMMMKTEIMNKVDGYTVHKNLERGQDYYLWYKIYKQGFKGYNLSERLYKMRDDKDAMDRRTIESRYRGFIVKKDILKGLGIKHGWLYALPDITKGFIPKPLMKILRKKKLNRQSNF